jgi:hypothetical protein
MTAPTLFEDFPPPPLPGTAPRDLFGHPLERGRLVHFRLPEWPPGCWDHGHVAATRHGRVLLKTDFGVTEVDIEDLLPF